MARHLIGKHNDISEIAALPDVNKKDKEQQQKRKDHVGQRPKVCARFVFLGTNEDERLRLELSKIKQGADGILMYNRKFCELADAAYGEQRQEEVERTIRCHYKTSLNDCDLAKKAILECDATTFVSLRR